VVASRIVFSAEALCEAADLQAGWRVLDVATGSGNAAIAAARRGCLAVGADYVPALLERGRLRASVEHLEVEFVEGDAEKLPFADGTFDAVLSIYGVMFAPDHRRAAAELVRVCKRGGRIALASWTPTGFIGDLFRCVAAYVPPAPGLTPPVMWGDESHLKSLFGSSIRSIRSHVRSAIFRFLSPEENVQFFRTYYGPTLKTFAAVGPANEQRLAKDMADLARRHDRNGGKGPAAIVGDYLETVIDLV
jgi:ubiquinone/menaquinone biosynthesis C-methylase UbiE